VLRTLITKSPSGIRIKVWPEGVTAGEIAAFRGDARPHPAAQVPFLLKGGNRVVLLNENLANRLKVAVEGVATKCNTAAGWLSKAPEIFRTPRPRLPEKENGKNGGADAAAANNKNR